MHYSNNSKGHASSHLTAARLRVVLLGTESSFTRHVLDGLLQAGVMPSAVCMVGSGAKHHASGGVLDVQLADSVARTALDQGIPLRHLETCSNELDYAQVLTSRPDILLTACCPEILSTRWISMPARAAVNVHPSLLPRYRGPCPLFWQLKDDVSHTGVSLHMLSGEVDAGPVLARQRFARRRADDVRTLERRLGRAGGRQAAGIVSKLHDGQPLSARAQTECDATYQGYPEESDVRFDLDSDGERVFRFMRATQPLGIDHWAQHDGLRVEVQQALSFEAGTVRKPHLESKGRTVNIQFANGRMHAIGRIVSSADH